LKCSTDLRSVALPTLLQSITISTSRPDFAHAKKTQLERFDGTT